MLNLRILGLASALRPRGQNLITQMVKVKAFSFRELVADYDPEGIFANDFIRRLFGETGA